jgi:hypothetical protein
MGDRGSNVKGISTLGLKFYLKIIVYMHGDVQGW